MKRGFTLVEMLVVLAIFGIVVALVVPALMSGCSMTINSGSGQSGFSNGERIGTVMKTSLKGNFTKAWSVEVALQGSGQIWETDILNNDPVMAAKFRKAARLGKVVNISYTQPSEENFDFHYTTPYRATNIQLVNDKGDLVEIEVSQQDVDATKAMMPVKK